MKRYLTTSILAIYVLASCNSGNDYSFRKGTELTDSVNQDRFVIQTQFDNWKMKDTIQIVSKESLVGLWTDSIILLHEENKWHGLRPIDEDVELRLFKSSKYERTESHTYSKLNQTHVGQYWTSNYNDSSFLVLAFNMADDTLFRQGDTLLSDRYLIDYFNIDTLILRPFDVLTRKAGNEATFMTRKNN